MNILVNGETQVVPDNLNLDQLLEHLDLTGKRLALEHNGTIVSRSGFSAVLLNEGDKIEIVHAIGGG